MDINEMHIVFRALGQQSGLQLVRGILPESIDVFINDTIIEWTRKRIIANVDNVYQDKITIQNNSISPINGIRTLYKKDKIVVGAVNDNGSYLIDLYTIKNVMFYTSFEVVYDNIEKHYGCRFVENDKLITTLSDYCNSASHKHPIITVYSNNDDEDLAELNIGNDINIPTNVIVNYITIPKKVKWNKDINLCINCNLPEYCHYEIVEAAVNKFFKSVGSTSQSISN